MYVCLEIKIFVFVFVKICVRLKHDQIAKVVTTRVLDRDKYDTMLTVGWSCIAKPTNQKTVQSDSERVQYEGRALNTIGSERYLVFVSRCFVL